MNRRFLQPLTFTAWSLVLLTSCHIHNGRMDFSPLTARFEPAVDDEVVLEGDTTSISTPIATPPDIAFTGAPVNTAPSVPAPTAAPTPSDPFAVAYEAKPSRSLPVPRPAKAVATYVVKAGDTLGGIARRSRATMAQLCSLNKLTPTSRLRIGQKLQLPASGSVAAAPAAKPAAKPSGKLRTHTIRAGETLYAVARRYNVSPAALMQANHLTPQTAGKLRIGSTLTIPAK